MRYFYAVYDKRFGRFYDPFLASDNLEAKQFVYTSCMNSPALKSRISDLFLYRVGSFEPICDGDEHFCPIIASSDVFGDLVFDFSEFFENEKEVGKNE